MSQHSLRFLEFFAGAGLVRFALAPAWQVQWANDIDPRKAEVYLHNFPHEGFVLGDISDVKAQGLPAPVLTAWASFPCQDLSLAGWRRGIAAPRSGTFWAFWQLMMDLQECDLRPPMIVLENVPGLLYGHHFEAVCEALAVLHLRFGALVMDAKRFVPQSRARVFVVAVDETVNVQPWIDAEPNRNNPWAPKSLWSAYARLSDPLKRRWLWWNVPVPTDPPMTLGALIDPNPSDAQWNSPEETERLLSMMTPCNHEKIVQALQNDGSVGTLYKRIRDGQQRAEVRFDGIGGCLRTPEGGSSRQTIVDVRNGRIATRLLTPREAARMMGVPDTFWLPDSYNNAYRAMGDGVVVPVVRWLGPHLLTPIARILPESPILIPDFPIARPQPNPVTPQHTAWLATGER